MPEPYATYIDGKRNTFATAMAYFATAYAYINSAGTWLSAQGHSQAGAALGFARDNLHLCRLAWFVTANNNYDYWEDLADTWLNDNVTPSTPFDMDLLLSTMLTASYDQLQSFIGIEDAYRSALWDQPFNAEFYAALARGFRP